ncbi:MAG: hypothetical protein ACYCSA_06855 [Thermoplasmataceae archaeon]
MLSRRDSSGTVQNEEFETVGQGKIIIEITKKCGDIIEKFSINPEHAPAFLVTSVCTESTVRSAGIGYSNTFKINLYKF